MLAYPAILASAALNNTSPVSPTEADVGAVAAAMLTNAQSFNECMGACFSQVCTAYSPSTGACVQRGAAGSYGCQKRGIGQCIGAEGCCLNATHSMASLNSSPVPDLRCAP
jgi:hypothetical protein